MIYACKIEKDKDMGYVASFPDLPNVNAFGASIGEALAMAKEAMDGAFECDLDLGLTFVYPKTEPNEKKGLYAVELSPKIEVAYKIFEARRGKTKTQVAKKAGISPQAYQRFETPKGSPSVETLYKIAAALGKKLEINFV
ncbi:MULTISPECIES: type II toxin-antitoxin system HicB family antitoxin [unclassified Fibrobacter]|uniref:type II toxin-antitoxin system HicB family antitoxin n=1 Tax=unclassified Fibrobacter TaxID=2634177 RepID=UPI000D6C7624|nr:MULTISPECIES: type II toxin-antitoxin system HicB family antitoxin [unclassified Fibrobacter]PWJ59812.1 antitoxin HicB [Fibrobacter sp. UWR4]PZW63767.1 antitoxin HicB [Fibrobacter sp. UWR1]